ncbi:unnamed protein product [Owenia fusiformis]|uniref:Sodium/calcium exchanger membrane region domain-containing protein n=1 Tax=Owenia fusiformis TaxID=6347 RepID=A0A8S4NME7_OWEFU|nr:unnamed protein product [Owenia fusiformis]
MRSRRREVTRALPYFLIFTGILTFSKLPLFFQNKILENGELEIEIGENDFLPLGGDFEKHTSRRLLADDGLPNCTKAAITKFPKGFFTDDQRNKGAIIIHILLGAYMFIALAIVCDDYFVPGLEQICEALHMSSDVAGATFMAAGSSAPELATSLIGTFVTQDDIALGAVVGSAVFNILFVISVCALFGGAIVQLNWYPMARDTIFYAISIVALVIVILDEKIYWYEGLILLLLYALYILLMKFNSRIEAYCLQKVDGCCNCTKFSCTKSSEDKEKILMNGNSVSESMNYNSLKDKHETGDTSESDFPSDGIENDSRVKTHLEEEVESPFLPPKGCWRKALWVISLPLIALLFITIPDCRKERWKKWYLLTFLMACIWTGLFSYVMVWMITVIGHTISIPDSIMGLTFIAAGASVPDAISSLLVVKDGFGDMAVSNAIGSNVFDILLCLGLPWFLKSIIQQSPIVVFSDGLVYSSIALFSTVIFLLLVTYLNGWRLTKLYGAILMVAYFVFLVFASLFEMNVFGDFNPPVCPIKL